MQPVLWGHQVLRVAVAVPPGRQGLQVRPDKLGLRGYKAFRAPQGRLGLQALTEAEGAQPGLRDLPVIMA